MQAVEIDKATTWYYTFTVLKACGYKHDNISIALAHDYAIDDKEDELCIS